MVICSHPPYGARGGLHARRRRRATLAWAPQGGPPHPRSPSPTQHLDDPDPPFPGPTAPGRARGHQRQRSPTTQGPPEQMVRTSHWQGLHRQPRNVAPQCSPQQSPLWLSSHPRPDHGDQRTAGTENRKQSPRTPTPLPGSPGSAGNRSKSRTPPFAARRVNFRDDANNSQDRPGGRQRRQMSTTAEPQQRPKRPRTEKTQITTILPATDLARLAALNVRAGTAEAAMSSSSAAPCQTRTSDTTPRPREPSAAPHAATLISTQSVHPSRGSRPATAQQHRPKHPHGPPKTPPDCRTRATSASVTTKPPAMAAQASLGDPDTARAKFPTLAAMQARSPGSVQQQYN